MKYDPLTDSCSEPFFQGDTITWLSLRHRSVADFLLGFTRLDAGGWYRPLSQSTVQAVLFPYFGMNPVPYRILTFMLFFSCSCAVYFLIRNLSANQAAACFGTIFFSTHVIHAISTYDIAFTPEILYTLFGIGSVLAYLSYARFRRRRDLWISVAFVTASLLSKETGVVFPVLLFGLWLMLLPPGDRPALRSLAPHGLVLGLYVVVVVGYLHVGGVHLTHLLLHPSAAEVRNYEFSTTGLSNNMKLATNWLFGLAESQWRFPDPWMPAFLFGFRVFLVMGMVIALWTRRRWLVLFGLVWFWTAVGPALPLAAHFLPYYLFAPLVGASLAVGVILAQASAWLSARIRFAGLWVTVPLISLFTAANANAAQLASEEFWLLGGGSRTSGAAAAYLRATHPHPPKGVTIAIVEEDLDLSWYLGKQGLFRLIFDDDSITTEFQHELVTIDARQLRSGSAIALGYAAGVFKDITADVLEQLSVYQFEKDREYALRVSRTAVVAGRDAYTLQLAELPNAEVHILYKGPDGSFHAFVAKLDDRGQVRFDVGAETPKGTYTFEGLQQGNSIRWTRIRGSVTVR